MRPISTDEVFRFAAQSGGADFKTLTDGSKFRVKVELGGLSFYPETGLGRPNSREFIERYVALFNQEQSLVTTPYVKAKLRSASYFVALVKDMLENVWAEPATKPPSAHVALVLPPDIEGQLIAFLQRSNKGGKAERNAEIVAFYYGFRGHPLPTLEETVLANGLRRERARQIIERNFRERVQSSDLPGVFRAQQLLRIAGPVNASDFVDSLRRENLIADDCSPAGLLRLIHDVTHDESVGIFDQDLSPTKSAKTIEQADELYFLPVEGLSAAQSALRDAKTLPGQLGIAKFRYLEEKLGPQSATLIQIVRRIVETSSQFWTKRDGSDLWYLCEERENTLINNLFKAHKVADSCPVEDLAAALHRALKSRSLDHPVAVPEVTALVAAHKKPRYRCTHSERIDPLIVMPLCLLGCDYLYERNLVFVENGVVCANPAAVELAGLGERVAVLSGKKIAERWTQCPDYFRKQE